MTLFQVMVVVWDSEPCRPLTVTGGEVIGHAKVSAKVDKANPPGATVTLVGLKLAVTPEGGVADRATVPEQFPILVTVMVAVGQRLVQEDTVPRFEGLAETVKSDATKVAP